MSNEEFLQRQGPAFTDGKEAFLRGTRFERIPPFYAGNGQRDTWELGWKVAEYLRKEGRL